MNPLAQAVQREADPGATPAPLSRRAMRRHRPKPKSLERSELSCPPSRWRPLHTPAQWWRDRVPCTLRLWPLKRGVLDPQEGGTHRSREGRGEHELLGPSSSKLV
jgi:hypothetical protein